jgi:hypothetical protein
MRHSPAFNQQQLAALPQAAYIMLPDVDATGLHGTASQGALAGERVKIEKIELSMFFLRQGTLDQERTGFD